MRPSSIINTIERYYNIDELEVLLNVDFELLPLDWNRSISKEEHAEMLSILKGTKKHPDGYKSKTVTFRKISYGNDSYGRLYPSGTRSIQGRWKFCRTVVFHDHVIGFDLVNSQPTILKQLVQKYAPTMRYHYLQAYINNCASMRKEVMNHYKVPIGDAKELFVRLCFGGSVNQWRSDNSVSDFIMDLDFIRGFHEDVQKIMKEVAETHFPDYQKAKRVVQWRLDNEKESKTKEINPPRSALAMYLQDIEGTMMLRINELLKTMGIEMVTVIHDEFCILADDVRGKEQQVIDCVKAHVKASMDLDINLKVDNYVMTDDYKQMLESHRVHAKIENDEYSMMKSVFEERAFKITDTIEYAFKKADGSLAIVKKRDFKDRFEYLQIPDDNGKLTSFVDRWLKDPEALSYERVDCLPPPTKVPDGVYNTWTGFDIENSKAAPKDPSRILELIDVLCNHDEAAYEYVLDWIAQMFQEPATKIGTAIIMKGQQGCGKGSLYKVLRRMMGGGLAAETANPLGDVFGSHGNLHIGKILVSIDEMNASDTNKVLDRLKNFITSDQVVYNEKGLKAYTMSNSARVMFSTNNSIPISLEGHRDRRYVFVEADNKWCKLSSHWIPFYEEVIGDQGVLRGFYDLLMKRDISARDWSAIPQTEIRQEMIEATVHPIVFWFDKFIHDHPIDRTWTPAKLYESYKSHCGLHGYTCCSNMKAFGIVFKDQIPHSESGVEKSRGAKGMTYRFNRKTAFEWLKNSGFSQYESLVLFEDDDDNDA